MEKINLSTDAKRENPGPGSGHSCRDYIVVVAIGILAHLWMLDLGFVLDDFDHLADASISLTYDSYLLGGRPPLEKGSDLAPFAYIIRPLLHTSLRLDLLAFGITPRAFHGMQVLYHLLCALLLLRLVKSLSPDPLSRYLGLLAAVFFVLHPAKMEAVLWISARGDVLVALFGLCAANLLTDWRSRGGAWRIPALFILTACAILSKETGILVAPLLVLMDLLVHRKRTGWTLGTSAILYASMAALLLSYFAWRAWLLGDELFYYGGQAGTLSGSGGGRMLDNVMPLIQGMTSGVFLPFLDGHILKSLACLLTMTLLALPLLTGNRMDRRGLAGVGLLSLSALTFNLFFYGDVGAVDVSRDFYLASIPWAVLVAWPVASALAAGGWRRSVSILLMCGIFICWGWAFDQSASTHHHASRIADSTIESSRTLAADLPPGTHVLVEGIPSTHRHAPVMGHFLGKALSPPFVESAIPVIPVPGIDSFIQSGGHVLMKSPIVFAKWNAPRRKIIPLTEVIAEPQPAPAPIEPRQSDPSMAVDLDTRSVGLITFHLGERALEQPLQVTFRMDTGSEHAVTLNFQEKGAQANRRSYSTAMEPWFARARKLVRISWGTGDEAPLVKRITFAQHPHPLVWEYPDPGIQVHIEGTSPAFKFSTPHPFPLYRIEWRHREVSVGWFFHAKPDEQGVVTWSPSVDIVHFPGKESPGWELLVDPLRERLDREGLAYQNVLVYALAYEGDPNHPVAFSRPLWIKIRP